MDISDGGRRLLMVDDRLRKLREELPLGALLGSLRAAGEPPLRLDGRDFPEYILALLLGVLLACPDVLALPPWPLLARIMR